MKEKDFIDKRVAFDDELVEVIRPAMRRRLAQNAGERQALELIRYLRRPPQLCPYGPKTFRCTSNWKSKQSASPSWKRRSKPPNGKGRCL